jgi:hypothetical protein
MPTRRQVVVASTASLLAAGTSRLLQTGLAQAQGSAWDQGQLAHLLPTVGSDRLLIKATFKAPLSAAPLLRVGGATVTGARTDTHGECWRFECGDLKPYPTYTLSLVWYRRTETCEVATVLKAPGHHRDGFGRGAKYLRGPRSLKIPIDVILKERPRISRWRRTVAGRKRVLSFIASAPRNCNDPHNDCS